MRSFETAVFVVLVLLACLCAEKPHLVEAASVRHTVRGTSRNELHEHMGGTTVVTSTVPVASGPVQGKIPVSGRQL